jgi:hypothetical protein
MVEQSLIDIVLGCKPSFSLIEPIYQEANEPFFGFLNKELSGFVALSELPFADGVLVEVELNSQTMLIAV